MNQSQLSLNLCNKFPNIYSSGNTNGSDFNCMTFWNNIYKYKCPCLHIWLDFSFFLFFLSYDKRTTDIINLEGKSLNQHGFT